MRGQAEGRAGKGAQGSLRGSRRPGRRAPLPHQGLVSRVVDRIARDEGRSSPAGGKEARQVGDRRGEGGARKVQVAVTRKRGRAEPALFEYQGEPEPAILLSSCNLC